MYKIYINGTPIFLMNTQEKEQLLPSSENILTAKYLGKPKYLLTYIDLLEKSKKFDLVVIYTDNYEKLIDDFPGDIRYYSQREDGLQLALDNQYRGSLEDTCSFLQGLVTDFYMEKRE